MTQFIYEKLNNSEKVMAIFLDLVKALSNVLAKSKATVDHKELIKILPDFGMDREVDHYILVVTYAYDTCLFSSINVRKRHLKQQL